jgi:hypothetical protein
LAASLDEAEKFQETDRQETGNLKKRERGNEDWFLQDLQDVYTGEPIGVESGYKIYSSKLREVGSLTLGTDEMSIEAGTEMDFLPLLVKETVGTVSALISGETNSGFRVSASILSVDVSLKWSLGGTFLRS